MYRVSIKAVIHNAAGEVLVVREKNNPNWNLPGGGLDYNESDYDALARELREEVGYEGDFTYSALGIKPIYVQDKNAWLLWVVYNVVPTNHDFVIGHESDDVTFMSPTEFAKQSPRVYEFAKQFLN